MSWGPGKISLSKQRSNQSISAHQVKGKREKISGEVTACANALKHEESGKWKDKEKLMWPQESEPEEGDSR